MSTWFDETIACPACGLEQRARLARGIHVSRASEAREQVFARTFHRVECSACGQRFVAKRPLIYNDMDRRHWLHVALADERPRWPELERVTSEIFERAFVGSPLVSELRDGFKVRLVFGIEELREKLEVWRAGFDDGVVECAKLQLFTRDPTLALAHRLLVDRVGDAGAEILVLDTNDMPTRTTLVPRELLEAAHDDYERLRRYLPELFGGGFVSWHRMLGQRYRLPATRRL